MAMTPYSGDTSVIGKLGTTPQERGLTTQQFKDKFDENTKNFVAWFNTTHLADIAAHANRKNILHNWDFSNPVNQRGQSSYTGAAYSIDRWKLSSADASLDVQSGNVKLTFVGDTDIRQYVENYQQYKGKTITFSVELASPTIENVAMGIYDGVSSTLYGLKDKTAGIYSVTRTIDNNATQLYVRIYGNQLGVTNSVEISRVKLELGSVSTLANDPPADYGEQLALCQRYCVVYGGASGYIGIGNAFSATNVYILINLPCSMRALPSISYSGSPILRTGATDLAITGLSAWGGVNGNCITLKADVSGATVGEKYMFVVSSSVKIILSADL